MIEWNLSTVRLFFRVLARTRLEDFDKTDKTRKIATRMSPIKQDFWCGFQSGFYYRFLSSLCCILGLDLYHQRIVSHRVILQNEKLYSECMQCMFWGKWTFCIIVLKQQQVKQKVNWTRIHLFKNHLPIQHVLSGSKTFSTRNPSPSATTCEPSELSVATVSSLRILFYFFFLRVEKLENIYQWLFVN